MLRKINVKSWGKIGFIIIIAVIGIAIALSFLRQNRILDKYRGHKDFPVVHTALEENLKFIRQNPNHDSAYYSLGQGFFGLGGFDDAIWAFKEAARISPSTSYYWSFLGKAYQAKKTYPEARDAYAKALELEPGKPQNYTTLAWLYYFRLDLEKDKAFEVLKRGLERFPNDKDILFDITRYYMYDENKQEFLKYAPRYSQIDPDNLPIKNAFDKWGGK